MQTDSIFAHLSLRLTGEFQKKKFTTGTLSPIQLPWQEL